MKDDRYDIDVLADHASHTQHIMLAVIIVLCAMLIAAVSVVLIQHRQFVADLQNEHAKYIDLLESIETTETYEYHVDQQADDYSDNIWVGRDYFGGETDNHGQSDEDPNP